MTRFGCAIRMSMITAIGILVVFAIFGLLMMAEYVPTFLALAAMAIGIGLVGGMAPSEIINSVIVDGSLRLSDAYVAVIFGAALGALVEKTGIAEDMVKTAAELGGDSPLVVSILLYVAIAASFTSLAGLGAYIMVATIVFPIMMSVGLPRRTVAGITLLGLSNGIMFNPANWVFYADVTGIQLQNVMVWAIPTGIAAFISGVAYIVYQTRKTDVQETWADSAGAREEFEKGVPTYSLVAPVVPVILVIVGIPVLPAFVVGILFAAILSSPGFKALTNPKQTMNQITQSFHEGIGNAAAAIALMVVIGWLLIVVFSDPVSATMEPLLSAIIPENMLLYAVMFIVLAPLALYRGPLNLWGLGSGIIGVLAAIGVNPQLITTTAVSALRVQAPADPTNTHNAWSSDELDVNVNEITKSVLPFAWVTAAAGIITSVVLFGL